MRCPMLVVVCAVVCGGLALSGLTACGLPEQKSIREGEIDAPDGDGAIDAAPDDAGDAGALDAIDAALVDAIDAAPVDAIDAAPGDGPDARTIDAAIDARPIDAPPIDAAIDAAVDAPIDAPPTPPIGNYDPLPGTTSLPANYIMARRFTLSAARTTTAAGLYLPSGGAGMVKFAIYNDNGLSQSAPTSLLAASGDVTLGAGQRPQGAIATTIGPGTFWLIAATSANITHGWADTNDTWGALQARSYASAFPATYSPAPSTSATSDAVNLYLLFQ